MVVALVVLYSCKEDSTEPSGTEILKGNFLTELGDAINMHINHMKKEIYFQNPSGIYAYNYETKVNTKIFGPPAGDYANIHEYRTDKNLIYITTSCSFPINDCNSLSTSLYKYEIQTGNVEKLAEGLIRSDFIIGEDEIFNSFPIDTIDIDMSEYILQMTDFNGNTENLPAKGTPLIYLPESKKLLMLYQENQYASEYVRYFFDPSSYDSMYLDSGNDYMYPKIYSGDDKLISVTHDVNSLSGVVTISDLYMGEILRAIPYDSYINSSTYHIYCNKFVFTKSSDAIDPTTGNNIIVLAAVDIESGEEFINTEFNVDGIYEMVIDYECSELIYSLETDIVNSFNFSLYSALLK